jgi:ABC-2 type transport system ATP-binding protein
VHGKAVEGTSVQAPRLAIAELRHRFATVTALDGLSIEVGRGEILGLMGPNGSGKSTALHALTGLVVPDGGTLRFDGVQVSPGGRALRRGMGVVFQAPSLDPRLSGRENLELAAALHGLRGDAAKRRVDELLAFAGLTERSSEAVNVYSGGMKRRLDLARALIGSPRLLVMDEPTTGLDEHAFRETWACVEDLRRDEGVSVLVATHRADEAARCDRVAIVDRGTVIAQGTPRELCSRVAGDVLVLQAEDLDGVARTLGEALQLESRLVDGELVIEQARGHELVPRIIDTLGPGRVQALSMRQPTLADVFVKLTGRALGEDAEHDG